MKTKCIEDFKCDARGYKICCFVCKQYVKCSPIYKCTFKCSKIKPILKKENNNGN
jgi:hypothetical protein